MYKDYQFGGMDIIWWLIWVIMMFLIFVILFRISNQRNAKGSPLNILNKRFATDQINKEEYEESKLILVKD
jgi:putative membrane protein